MNPLKQGNIRLPPYALGHVPRWSLDFHDLFQKTRHTPIAHSMHGSSAGWSPVFHDLSTDDWVRRRLSRDSDQKKKCPSGIAPQVVYHLDAGCVSDAYCHRWDITPRGTEAEVQSSIAVCGCTMAPQRYGA